MPHVFAAKRLATHCDPNLFINYLLKKEEVEKIVEAIQKGTLERCLKPDVEENEVPYKCYISKEDQLSNILYSMAGMVKDISNMEKLFKDIQDLLFQYEDVLCLQLPQGIVMKLTLLK